MSALIVLAYLSLLTLGLADNIRGPFFLEILKDLHLNGTSGSLFFAVVNLIACVGSWYSHRLLKGRDPLALLALANLIFALGFAGISQASHLGWMLVFCGIFGWSYGTLNVLQNVIVCEAAAPDQRRRLLNGLQSMYGLAALSAPLTATLGRLAGYDWRQVFLALSFIPLLMTFFSWRHRGEVPAPSSETESLAPAWGTSDKWACAGLSLLMALYLWGELSISTRLVLWLRSTKAFTAEAADSQLALFFALLLGGRLTLALLPLRNVANRTILLFSMISSAFVYALGLAYWPLLLSLAGLTLAPFYPVLMDQIAVRFKERAGRAMGIIIAVGNLSIVSMHVCIGVLTDEWGLSAALICGPAALLIAATLFFWQERRALTL